MKLSLQYILTFLLGFSFLFSCEDKIDRRDMYTFTGQMATDYINSNPNLSLYAKMLTISRNSKRSNSSQVSSLLGTRGHFTVFAPTNEGIKLYLDSIYGTNNYDIDTIPQNVAEKIVLNSVIDNGIEESPMMIMNLYEGGLVEGTLNDHHMMIRFGDWGDNSIVRINNCSRIIKGDIEVENGYVHIVDRVIVPGPSTLPGLIGQTPDFRIFSLLLNLTSWDDSLSIYEDKTYNDSTYFELSRTITSSASYKLIRYRLARFTAFLETDDVFQKDWGVPPIRISAETGGIENKEEILAVINQKCKEIYSESTSNDYKSESNAVNQFVSYHFLPSQNKYDLLIPTLSITDQQFGYTQDYVYAQMWKKHNPIDRWQYFTTMGHPRRILKTTYSANNKVIYLNRHCLYDNTYNGDYHETACTREGILIYPDQGNQDNMTPNGCYYRINHVLTYNNDVRNHVLNERIRYGVIQNTPELVNYGNSEKIYNDNVTFCIPFFFGNNIHLGTNNRMSTTN